MSDKLKLVANTTARGVYISYYTENGTLSNTFLKPGLNRVGKDVLKRMMKQKAFTQLLDTGVLAANKADLDRGRDVDNMVKAGKGSTSPIKPERTPNSDKSGASLHRTDSDAADTDETGRSNKKRKGK